MDAVITRSRRRTLLEIAALSAEALLLAMAMVVAAGMLFNTRQPQSTGEGFAGAAALALLLVLLMAGAHALLRAGRGAGGAGGARMAAGALAIGGGTALLVWLAPWLPGLAPAEGAGVGYWVFALLVALAIWWRAARERDLSRQGTMTSFRLGAFAAVGLGMAVAYTLPPGSDAAVYAPRQAMAMLLLWLYFGAALSAVLLARLHDTTLLGSRAAAPDAPAQRAAASVPASPAASGAASGARPPVFAAALPWPRAAALLAPVAGLMALGVLAALVWSQRSFDLLFGLLRPVTRALGQLVGLVVVGIFWVFAPLMEWLEELATSMQTDLPMTYETFPTPVPTGRTDATDLALAGGDRPWLYIGLAVLLGLLLLFVLRRSLAALRAQPEAPPLPAIDWGPPEPPPPPAAPSRASELTPTELLAATNVRNLYANVCRLAARLGAPRPLDVAPDAYLATLRRLFPGAEAALGRITLAYMRVHYGDIPTDPAELDALRADWESIRSKWA